MTVDDVAAPPAYNASVDGADELVRLHLSESAYGASPAATAAAGSALERISVYPDPGRVRVAEALAAHYRLPAEQIVVSNGSDELVLFSTLALGGPELPGLVTEGTFPGYLSCLETVRRPVRAVPLRGATVDVDAVIEQLPQCGVGYLCNPHNPSGGSFTRAEMDRLVAAAARTGVPLVFDEAYMEFAEPDTPQARDYLDGTAPVIALRTFSKAYGLAALRIGYAIGAAGPIRQIRAVQGVLPFSANRSAQAAAAAAVADQEFVRRV
ncbi:MAG: aminotransferase class I/II-fold pyridoxal phosphate-dependent enzyme, partial [Actinocatenispora sp.]